MPVDRSQSNLSIRSSRFQFFISSNSDWESGTGSGLRQKIGWGWGYKSSGLLVGFGVPLSILFRMVTVQVLCGIYTIHPQPIFCLNGTEYSVLVLSLISKSTGLGTGLLFSVLVLRFSTCTTRPLLKWFPITVLYPYQNSETFEKSAALVAVRGSHLNRYGDGDRKYSRKPQYRC
jgi:hypothetical protein